VLAAPGAVSSSARVGTPLSVAAASDVAAALRSLAARMPITDSSCASSPTPLLARSGSPPVSRTHNCIAGPAVVRAGAPTASIAARIAASPTG